MLMVQAHRACGVIADVCRSDFHVHSRGSSDTQRTTNLDRLADDLHFGDHFVA